MNRLKQLLVSLLRALAGWVVQHRLLKHLAFAVLSRLPRPVQARLRRLAAPGARIAPPSSRNSPSGQLLSPWAERIFLDLKARTRQRAATEADPRPRLAFVSPLPPQRSGISDYSADLLPALAAHYRIEVVVDQKTVIHPWIEAHCPVRDIDWFRAHGHEFDRVLYQFGNSLFHAHMFALLEDIPGVVVLHDFFLGHVVANIDAAHPDSGFLAASLYRGLGYPSLRDHDNGRGVQQVIWDNPCNLPVLTAATGVIVHSRYSRELARRFYPLLDCAGWAEVPLPRLPPEVLDRGDARRRLGIPEQAFVVCSFGHLVATKLSDQLLEAWLASSLASDPNCWLVFVGDSPVNGLGPRLEARVRASGLGARVRITGWVDGETYRLYQQAGDVGVQLRARSRGETSAAALDCMGHGLATIVNAHGSMADLPEDRVWMLADEFSQNELTKALEALWRDPAPRQRLGSAARQFVAERHHPRHCAGLYRDAIEGFHRHRQSTYLATLDNALGELAEGDRSDRALAILADRLTRTLPQPRGHRQLLVDVSAIARNDLRTGIERVARAQLLALMADPPPGYRVEPVYLVELEGRWRYCHARRYARDLLQAHGLRLPDELVELAAGDILYIPDFFPQGMIAAEAEGLYRELRERGVKIAVLVHDLLPITLPDCFPPGADLGHRQWLAAACGLAHRLICISRAVATAVESLRPEATEPPAMSVLHHGADIASSAPSRGLPRRAKKVLARLARSPSFLMVGTVEPRKCHLQVLEAFDLLWQRGLDLNLVIVGAEGWKTLEDSERRTIPETVRRLEGHPLRERRLFWLAGISDQYLEALYGAATCLIAASRDEGFGLPLIEAAQHGLPVLARDIPVFREVAGDHAHYFTGDEATALADAVEAWLALHRRGQAPDSSAMPWRTWADNAASLGDILTG